MRTTSAAGVTRCVHRFNQSAHGTDGISFHNRCQLHLIHVNRDILSVHKEVTVGHSYSSFTVSNNTALSGSRHVGQNGTQRFNYELLMQWEQLNAENSCPQCCTGQNDYIQTLLFDETYRITDIDTKIQLEQLYHNLTEQMLSLT